MVFDQHKHLSMFLSKFQHVTDAKPEKLDLARLPLKGSQKLKATVF